VKASVKIGIVGATGDRLEDDIRTIGRYMARIFDQIIIRHDRDNRGRTKEQLTELLMEGIRAVDPARIVTVISDEKEAIRYAMENAPKDAFIFVGADDVRGVLDYMTHAQQEATKEAHV
jgi:cyanophycin synthetase